MRFGETDRRDFFRDSMGHWFGRILEQTEERLVHQRYFRPPGAITEVAFLATCTRCGDCMPVCPVQAILKVPPSGGLAAGTPYIEPQTQPCIVCADMPCTRACPTGALSLPSDLWAGYRLGQLEFLAERCVTFHGTTCAVCAEACPVGPTALEMDSAGHPVLKREGCVGCGVCVRACITSPPSFELRAAEG